MSQSIKAAVETTKATTHSDPVYSSMCCTLCTHGIVPHIQFAQNATLAVLLRPPQKESIGRFNPIQD